MKKLRIGVIGTGRMGERHTRVCANLQNVELVGVSDADRQRGQAVAIAHETQYFETPDELLSKVDAVTIAASTQAHFELVKQCASAGVAVMIEKPLAATAAEAEQIAKHVESTGTFVQVGHIERFNPTFTELVSVIEGLDLIGVSIRRLSPADTSNNDVDVVLDLMIHDLDLIAALIGAPPHQVSAHGRSQSGRSIDHAVANLSFRPGPIATLSASRVTQEKVRMIEVIADGAYVQADLLRKSISVHRRTFGQYLDQRTSSTYRQEALIEQIHVPAAEPLMLELAHFVDCVRTGQAPLVSVQDGLLALRLAEEIAESVALEESFGRATASTNLNL